MKKLFEKALHIEDPWYIEEIRFSEDEKKLEIKKTSIEVLHSIIEDP